MKRLPSERRWMTLVILLLLLPVTVGAQEFNHRSNIKRTFPVSGETTLELENKYGTILVVPWKKDSIQVNAELYLEAKSQGKLRKLRNDVDVKFSSTKYYIIAETRIGNENSRIMSEIRALGNTLRSKSSVEVNYTVYIPATIDLVLDNKYGDIFIDDLYGDVDISLSNGALKANHLYGNTTLDLSFANGMIRELRNSKVTLSYAELDLGSVEQFDLVSKSSELFADTVGVMKIDSRRDRFSLGVVEYLYGNTSFSDVTVTTFIRESDCFMQYGKLTLEHVLPGFSRINVNSDYTDITLWFDAECTYDVDLLFDERVYVTIPEADATLNTTREGEDIFSIKGFVGNTENDSEVRIKALNKCYINLKTR